MCFIKIRKGDSDAKVNSKERINTMENIQINGKRAYPLSLKYAGNRLYGHLLECLQDGADRQQ